MKKVAQVLSLVMVVSRKLVSMSTNAVGVGGGLVAFQRTWVLLYCCRLPTHFNW